MSFPFLPSESFYHCNNSHKGFRIGKINFGTYFNLKDGIKIVSLITYVFSSDPLQVD